MTSATSKLKKVSFQWGKLNQDIGLRIIGFMLYSGHSFNTLQLSDQLQLELKTIEEILKALVDQGFATTEQVEVGNGPFRRYSTFYKLSSFSVEDVKITRF